jgi:hypothetical protein
MTSFPAGMPGALRELSNLLSVKCRGTFHQFLGFILRKNAAVLVADYKRWSRAISGRASVVFFPAFERIPVRLAHFEESCNSQVLPIATREGEPLRSQK